VRQICSTRGWRRDAFGQFYWDRNQFEELLERVFVFEELQPPISKARLWRAQGWRTHRDLRTERARSRA
jgi:hypothetical protein